MKKNVLLILIFVTTLIQAQQNHSADVKTEPFIEVIGTFSKKVIPDIIFISINLSEKTVGRKTVSVTEQENILFDILKRLSIDQNLLSLSDASSSIIKRKRRETGVKLEKEYILEVNSAGQLTQVFNRLSRNNIKEVFVAKTENSKIIEIRKEVRIAAIQAAKAKAQYLLEAIDEKLGSPLIVRELENERQGIRISASNGIMPSRKKDALLAEFEEIEVKFSYFVKYSIQ